MKTTRNAFLTLAAILIAASSYAQQTTAILDFLKVKPGKWDTYLEAVDEVKKIQQARIDKGIIVAWELFEVMYARADAPYHFVAVSVYDDYKKSEHPYPKELIQDVYPEEELSALKKKLNNSRTLVKTEVYFERMSAENGSGLKYLMFHRMKTNPGKGADYKKLQRKTIKPVMEEIITAGGMSGWSSWDLFMAGKKANIVTVDGYTEFGQWMERWPILQESYKKVFPDGDFDATGEKIYESRTHVSQELWKLIHIMTAPEE